MDPFASMTERRPITDVYGRHAVVDPYRWLEAVEAPEVQAWLEAQHQRSRGALEGLARWAMARERLSALLAVPMRQDPKFVGGRLYYLERKATPQRRLCRDGDVFFDPHLLDPSGMTAIDWYFPSPDGHVALGLSTAGSEASQLRVLDPNGRFFADTVEYVPHATVVWSAGSFLYTRQRLPQGPEGPSGVWRHRLGVDDDELVFEGAAGARYAVDQRGGCILVEEVHFPDVTLHFDPGDGFRVIGTVRVGAAVVLREDGVHVGDAQGHRRFVNGTWRAIDPRPVSALHFIPAGVLRVVDGSLYLGDRVLSADPGFTVRLASGSSACAHVVVESFCSPTTVCRVGEHGLESLFPSTSEAPAHETVTYLSDKGVAITMALLGPPGGPVMLTAYGAGGMPYRPMFTPDAALWLQWGGRVAIPSIRSADTPTDGWPTAGRFASIENAYREVIAAVRWLRANGAKRVSAYGVSHGGLVMAGALTLAPDVFDAVSCHVPLTDMFRHAVLADGWMTSTYGDPREPGHADWLIRTSPYHQIAERSYPPVLVSVGLRDGRVHPSHGIKFAAALQAVGGRAWLTVDQDAGHGVNKPLEAKVIEVADRVTFLWSA